MALPSPLPLDNWINDVAHFSDLPKPPPDMVVLFGFLGDNKYFPPALGSTIDTGTARTEYRLYRTIQLDEYFIIKHADIIWAKAITEGHYTPIGGHLLWVKASAELEYVRIEPPPDVHGRTRSLEFQAAFLRGPMVDGGGGGGGQANAAALGGGGGGGGGLTLACGGGGLTLACGGGGLTLACGGGGLTLACGGGGLTLACGGGGLTLACGGGGLTLACGGGGLTVVCAG